MNQPTPVADDAHILHVDMDAFFASVELIDCPDLRGKPVIVGGAERSVVLAATYEARAFGVHSAMPMARARALCPQAIIIPPHRHRYHEVSHGVMEILQGVTPMVEQISVDEAFLDVAGARRRLGSPSDIAERIRERVRQDFSITCSVGIASNKSVAKIASDRAKPDGVLEVPASATVAFLHQLDVGALWGVGAKTQEALARWGIRTVKDLAHTDPRALRQAVGVAAATHLYDLAWGRDERPVSSRREEKSIGAERTFGVDTSDSAQLRQVLLELVEASSRRMREMDLACHTVSIKIRSADFVTLTRSRSMEIPTDVSRSIFSIASSLFAGVHQGGQQIRLLGVRLDNLAPVRGLALQPSFDDLATTRREAERAADGVRAKFGREALKPGSLVGDS